MAIPAAKMYFGKEVSFEDSLRGYDFTYKASRGDGKWHDYQPEAPEDKIGKMVQDHQISETAGWLSDLFWGSTKVHPVRLAGGFIVEKGIVQLRDLFDEKVEGNYQSKLYLNCARASFRSLNYLIEDVHNSNESDEVKNRNYQAIIDRGEQEISKYEQNPALVNGLRLAIMNGKKLQELANGRIAQAEQKAVAQAFQKSVSFIPQIPKKRAQRLASPQETKSIRQAAKKVLGIPSKGKDEVETLPPEMLPEKLGELGGDLKAMKEKVENFERYIAEQKERERIAEREHNISLGFGFLQGIGEITGSQSIQKAAVVGQATYRIMSQMRTLGSLTAAAPATAFLGPLAAIGLAGLSIVKIFKKAKPGGEQLITRHLQALSQQMAQMQQQMQQGFQQLQHNQKLIYDAAVKGLDFVHYTLSTKLDELKYLTISRLDDIETHLATLQEISRQKFENLTLLPLKASVARIGQEYGRHQRSAPISISPSEFEELKTNLDYWLLDTPDGDLCGCKEKHLNGTWVQTISEPYPNLKTLNSILGNSNLGEIVSLLASFADSNLVNHEEYVPLVNVDAWARALVAYKRLSDLKEIVGISRANDQVEIEQILQSGHDVLTLVKNLRDARAQLFPKLLTLYSASFEDFRTKVEKQGLSKQMGDDLQRLAKDGPSFEQLFQQGNFEIGGKTLSLQGAHSKGVTLSSLCLLAVKKGLGTITFVNHGSKRAGGVVWQNGKIVHITSPVADYTVDCILKLEHEEQTIPIAVGKGTIGGFNSTVTRKKQADHTAREYRDVLNPQLQLPLETFLASRWNSSYICFEPSTDPDAQANLMTKVLEHYRDPSNPFIQEVIGREDVRHCLTQLTVYRRLLFAYARLIGIMNDETFNLLEQLPSGEKLVELIALQKDAFGMGTKVAAKLKENFNSTLKLDNSLFSSPLELFVSQSMLYFNGEINANPLTEAMLDLGSKGKKTKRSEEAEDEAPNKKRQKTE